MVEFSGLDLTKPYFKKLSTEVSNLTKLDIFRQK